LATHGTIILVLPRRDFIVVAADRMCVQVEPPNPPVTSQVTKIVCHPRLPLAVAIGGVANVEMGAYPDKLPGRSGEGTVFALIEQAFGEITAPGELRFERLLKLVRARVVPHVQNAQKFARDETPGSDPMTFLNVCSARWGKPDYHQIMIKNNVMFRDLSPPNYGTLSGADEMEGFLKAHLGGDVARIYARDESSPDELAAHAVEVIAAAVEWEKAVKKGEDLHCGGGVDVALVDERGARFVLRG
jgi:hypothetical protein